MEYRFNFLDEIKYSKLNELSDRIKEELNSVDNVVSSLENNEDDYGNY